MDDREKGKNTKRRSWFCSLRNSQFTARNRPLTWPFFSMRTRGFLCVVSLALLVGSNTSPGREPVRARHGMVVTVEPHATAVGVSVLQHGGNAIDAAVAIGFTLAVTHPSAGNLGGGGFMLIRLSDGRRTFIDFRESAPATARPTMYLDQNGERTKGSDLGYRASGVPGTLRGLEFALRKYGSKSWADLISPAWQLAS